MAGDNRNPDPNKKWKTLRFEDYFIHEAPHPVFSRLDRLHDGMFGGVKMLCRMFVFGRIAAADMAAFAAQTQMNPGIAHFQAFFAAFGLRFHFLDMTEVRTTFAHAAS
jgi:hypothetical protein